MKFSAALLLLAPISLGVVMTVAQGCSSATQGLADGTDPVAMTPAGGGGTGGAPPAVPGGAGAGGGGLSCTGENMDATCVGINTDASCNSTDASSGAACTKDCRLPCGFDEMSQKICTCTGGTYSSCPCARPDAYQGAPTAGFCTQGMGLTSDLDEQACTVEWEQCIARDPVPGTPRGCVCKMSSETNALQWFCGSTNNWFALESEGGTGVCEGATPDPTCYPVNEDPSCNTTLARSGSACTKNCLVACGYASMGLKTCTCESGVYSSCPCPKPESYLGAATAPPCASPDGTAEALDDQPCTVEWDQCIGSDVVTGNTPRGCACMLNRLTSALQWYCGSTNRWFAPQ